MRLRFTALGVSRLVHAKMQRAVEVVIGGLPIVLRRDRRTVTEPIRGYLMPVFAKPFQV